MSLKKAQITKENVIAYLEGNLRYKLFYSKRLGWLIRKHIREQIDFRIKFMDKQCYNEGACKLCGCQTTALQMATKRCEKPCYPTLFSKRQWKLFKAGGYMVVDKDRIWEYFPAVPGQEDFPEELVSHTRHEKYKKKFNTNTITY